MHLVGWSRDRRTWLLLVLALVPPASVLAGAMWLWSARGTEIAEFEAALVPVETSHDLYHVGATLLTAHASLTAAALPDAGDAVIARAATDRAAAIDAIEEAERVLPILVAKLAPREDEDSQALALISSSIGMAADLMERQRPGAPLLPEMGLLASLTRDNAGGLVLPFVGSGDLDVGYLYDTMSATIRYHEQYDRDRERLIAALVDRDPAPLFDHLAGSPLRFATWNDLVDSRTFTPNLHAGVSWQTTSNNPDSPLLIDRSEPLASLLALHGVPQSPGERDELVLDVLELADALQNDVEQLDRLLDVRAADHLHDLAASRTLMLIASALMTLLGSLMAMLTVSEVRHRRSVEVAHDDAIERLADKALRDPTTGAWNRRRLEATVVQLLVDARSQGESVVLAYVDLDHFKAINDVWGHHAGDTVLRTLANRLTDFAHDGVRFELTRFGGDEFVLYARTEVRTANWLDCLGSAIIAKVGSEMAIDGRKHVLGASVGIAMSNGESTLRSLLLEADSSLILAKRERRGTAMVYNRDTSRTGELVQALPAALAGGQISCHFQPIVDAASGEILHVEALARWTRPGGETVSPSVFVPLVESYGFAEDLTAAVLDSVCHFIERPDTPPDLRIWINISPSELDIVNFAGRFVRMLEKAFVPADRIGIEITETATVRDPVRLGDELDALRQMGIGVAIDDFGAGYSPLGYLRSLPVDTVKLDRSLIAGIESDLANQHIVIGVVGMLRELGIGIVAEGVEQIAEEAWLLDHGIRRIQGYLWARPMAAHNFEWRREQRLASRR